MGPSGVVAVVFGGETLLSGDSTSSEVVTLDADDTGDEPVAFEDLVVGFAGTDFGGWVIAERAHDSVRVVCPYRSGGSDTMAEDFLLVQQRMMLCQSNWYGSLFYAAWKGLRYCSPHLALAFV